MDIAEIMISLFHEGGGGDKTKLLIKGENNKAKIEAAVN